MTLKDKLLNYAFPTLLGLFIAGGAYLIKKHMDDAVQENTNYVAQVTKPDVLIPIGDIDGNGLDDYVILDSFKDKEGNNKNVGRGFIFLGHSDGAGYHIDKFKLTKDALMTRRLNGKKI